jgi:hypothetical protein
METLLRRLLGMYFVVTSIAYVPTALAFLGVESSFSPWWLVPAVPASQAVILFAAGLVLLRRRPSDGIPVTDGVVFPPIESLLQLAGLFFIVTGLASLVQPTVDMLLVTESWSARLGSFAAAAVWCLAGSVFVTRPRQLVQVLRRRRSA